jgi:hypothetical protein
MPAHIPFPGAIAQDTFSFASESAVEFGTRADSARQSGLWYNRREPSSSPLTGNGLAAGIGGRGQSAARAGDLNEALRRPALQAVVLHCSAAGLRETMVSPPDIRLKASGSQIARARNARFPLGLQVHCASAGQALAQARQVITQLRQAAEQAEIPDASLSVPDLDEDSGRSASELIIEQKSQREVRLHLTFAVTLKFGESRGFWHHAAALALAADFLQGFAQRPHEKGVVLDIQQAGALDEGVAP